jgi:hypothetical protein
LVEVGVRERRAWQVGVRSALLLTGAVGVWLAFAMNRQRNAELTIRVKTMRPLARALLREDLRKIAVVKLQDHWMDENQWDLYLPPGNGYRLCLATRKVDNQGLSAPIASVPLPPGRHRILMEQTEVGEVCRIDVSCDHDPILSAEEPKTWNSGSSSTTVEFTESTQLAADRPVVLQRTRLMHRDAQGRMTTRSDDPPGDGILLWIEPVGPASRRVKSQLQRG